LSERNGHIPLNAGGHVLVVDDLDANRSLVRYLLEMHHYRVTEAADGLEALCVVAQDPPDVIVLDVMMPGIDGIEVCRRLKADPESASIPVLLLTALQEPEDRRKGIEAGANDFLAKPMDMQEVLLRIRNAVTMRQLFTRVAKNYHQLKELEALRDSLTHMIVHDMRTPLTGMCGYLELLQQRAGAGLDEASRSFLAAARSQATELADMATSVLDVSRLESASLPLNRSRCDLLGLARDAVASLGLLANNVQLAFAAPPEPVWVTCDAELIRRVTANLVGNAAKYSPQGGTVRVTVEWLNSGSEARARLAVSDDGPGIPPEHRERIFEKFAQIAADGRRILHSTGLGLTFCKLAVEAHGGQIAVESSEGRGSTFWYTLPPAESPLSEPAHSGEGDLPAAMCRR
jgi:two-component system, sensor histidine kinase and response regulator